MKKYILNVPFDTYKKGHIFKTNENGIIVLADTNHYFEGISGKELALMVHTGFLSIKL